MVRGLKSLIAKTSPGKLVKAKQYTCYRATTEAGRPRVCLHHVLWRACDGGSLCHRLILSIGPRRVRRHAADRRRFAVAR